MTTRLEEALKNFSTAVVNGDFLEARSIALAWICNFCNARSGALFFMDQRPSISYGTIDGARDEKQMLDFVNSPETMLRTNENILLKLNHGQEIFGILLLQQCANSGQIGTALQTLSAFLELVEQSETRTHLLELSQEGLRNLSRESTAIAQSNAQLFHEMASNETRLRSISRGVLRMQEEERSKISRELHDGIGQALTALKMNIELTIAGVSKEVSPQSMERLQDLKGLAEQSLEDVRELSRLLRPRILDDLGLFPTLRWYTRRFGERTGIQVTLEMEEVDKRFDPEIETMLFRITQEALNNAAKHSQSPTARIRLKTGAERIELEISDQGVGFDPARVISSSFHGGAGLSGIRDRVSLWSGEFLVRSQSGAGTTLHVTVPLNKSHKRKAKSG